MFTSHGVLLPPSVSFCDHTRNDCELASFPSANFTHGESPRLPRYDSEGRLTNVTYPTGMVTSLHREIERSINIDIESSSRDDDVTVITNLSSVEASYTVVQGIQKASSLSGGGYAANSN